MKAEWRNWLERYVQENTELVQNATSDNLTCSDCGRNIAKATFVNHRTKGHCKHANPKIRLKNWK